MDMVKVTFTLDDATVASLRQSAARMAKPQSLVVREAIADYAARAGRLSERERAEWLHAFDELMPASPARPARAVDAEIRAVRAARRTGGRRSSGRHDRALRGSR
jgi:predicted transcriptional regulator